ncbi:nucleotidyltransferase domain-containing protein [Rhodopila globiformis]|uniref:nucleotidyltransferase domain-containing protein n=1 Tax=Rhodopila globiformis TaxID=1071 RepID=UPI001EFDF693|nr:nucleotidyltransferase domain-containing protein [Rhodopila globiformis]
MAKRATYSGDPCYDPAHGPETQTGMAMRTATDILPIEAASRLAAYKRDVQRALPGVEKMILFGSRARNQARADSDYDIAVVVRDLADRRHVRRVLSSLAYDHILSGFFIRPIPLPSDYLRPRGRRVTELAEDILRDGVEIT